MRTPGKKVGSCIYVHSAYEWEVIPKGPLVAAKQAVGCGPRGRPGYTAVKYDARTGNVSFIWALDFDFEDEPHPDFVITVRPDGTKTRTEYGIDNPPIWHHKWMWVADDYAGFDVEESKARSRLWGPHVTKEERRRIGRCQFWDSIRHRWEKT